VNIFLKKPELPIDKICKKKLIICGDWNINFLHKIDQVQTLQNISVSYDLINIVTSSTRVICSSESLLRHDGSKYTAEQELYRDCKHGLFGSFGPDSLGENGQR
jgi:hypothetical protein